jgi:hypothetical protein
MMLVAMQLPWIMRVYGFDWEKRHVEQTEALLLNAFNHGVRTSSHVEKLDLRFVTSYNTDVLASYWTGMTAHLCHPMSHL